MTLEKYPVTPSPAWDTTTTPAPTAAPVPPPDPETPGPSGRGWLGWLLAALLLAGLVFVKIKYFPGTPGDKKGGGKGGAAKGGPVARTAANPWPCRCTWCSPPF